MPFDLICGAKIVAALTPTALSLGKGELAETLAKALEGALKGGEAIKGLHEPQHKLLSAALGKGQTALEALYADSLRSSHSAGFREQVDVAFANFSEVIARCLPSAEALAAMNHDPNRVADAVVEAALAIDMDIFAEPHGEARRMLTTWVAATYRVLRAEPAFVGAMAGVNWATVLEGQERIEGKIDAGFARVQAEADRRLDEMLDAMRTMIARDEGVDPEVLRPLFDHLGQEGLSREQLRVRAQEAVAAILARAREAPVRTNFGPEIDAIIAAARARLAALDTAGAVSILDGQIAEEDSAYRRRQIPLLREKAAVQRLAYDRAGAMATLRRLLALDPDQVWRWIDLGDLAARAGATADALSAYRSAEAAAQRIGDVRGIAVSKSWIGDVYARQGQLGKALEAYETYYTAAERLAAADPGDAQAQRDLSVSHEKIGDIRARQGDLGQALDAYRADLAIAERLAAADPGDAQAQRDLSVSHSKIGDIRARQGDLGQALDAYRASLIIAERLAAADPGDAQAQRDLSVSHDRIGDIRARQGDLGQALDAFRASLVLRERLAAADPGDAQAQRDLSVSHNRIGDIRARQGDLGQALDAYRADLEIAERLAAADPGDAQAQRDLSISHNKIGDIRARQNDLGQALDAYRAGLVLRERLAAADPGDAEAQRDLFVSCVKIAEVAPTEAEAMLARALDVLRRLQAEGRLDPEDANWPAEIERRLAAAGAVEELRRSTEVMAGLVPAIHVAR